MSVIGLDFSDVGGLIFKPNLFQLPDVVLIKDEDSDTSDSFEEGE